MNAVVLAALTEATGNAVIGRRIADHLGAPLVDTATLSPQAIRTFVRDARIDAVVALHALLAGPFARAAGVPYVLVFGGTDLYEPAHELHRAQMSRAVAGAARLAAFSAENAAQAGRLWPCAAGRVAVVPQAVIVPPAPPAVPSLRTRLGLARGDVLALLPTGLRRVKDPLFAIDAMAAWHARDPRVHLAVVGAPIEPDYAADAIRALASRPGIHYLPALPRAELCAAMADADVVLNTSISEGLCCTLLEAMRVGTPVVARRNAGNADLIAHGRTGFLYDHDRPDELVACVSTLVASAPLRARVAAAASAHIDRFHGPTGERDAYLALVGDLAHGARHAGAL
jgi:glycosyltransferase involved in cell wall biosynthesis